MSADNQRRIRIASMIWAVGILLSRFIGIVREAVIGRVLGAGADADVYFAGFTLPDFLGYLLAGGALSIVFIPIFSGYIERGDEEGGWRAFSHIANFIVAAMGAALVGLWFAAPALAPVVSPGFDEAQLAELVRVTRIMLPGQLFHLLGGLLSAVLMARDRHTLPALAPLLYTGSIITCGVLLGPTMGAEGFAWGVLVGSALGPFGLPLIGCLRTELRWRPLFSLRDPDFKQYLWLSLPIMLAFSVIAVDDWVLKRVGSTVGEGVVARLQYAKTLMKVPMGVFGLATGAAAYPTISRLVAAGQRDDAYATLMRAVRSMLVLAFAAQAGLTVAGPEVAEVILGTRRFEPSALEDIGLYAGLFCLGLWGWAAQTVLARGFYAMKQTWLPSLSGSAVMIACYPLYVLLAERMGGAGLALASSVAITVYVSALAILLRRYMPTTAAAGGAPGLLDLLARMIPATGLGIVAGEAIERALPEALPALIAGGIAGSVGLGAALALGWALRVREVREVIGVVAGKVARRLKRR